MQKQLFKWLISMIPMTGNRTYIMGGVGLLLGGFLIFNGDGEAGAGLIVLSLQAIFSRSGVENLKDQMLQSLEENTIIAVQTDTPIEDEPDTPVAATPIPVAHENTAQPSRWS